MPLSAAKAPLNIPGMFKLTSGLIMRHLFVDKNLLREQEKPRWVFNLLVLWNSRSKNHWMPLMLIVVLCEVFLKRKGHILMTHVCSESPNICNMSKAISRVEPYWGGHCFACVHKALCRKLAGDETKTNLEQILSNSFVKQCSCFWRKRPFQCGKKKTIVWGLQA